MRDTLCTKYYSSVQEKAVADALNMTRVSGSGASACLPGDVTSNDWLIECKTHTEPHHAIFFGANIWKKIATESMAKFKHPALIVDDGSQKLTHTWVLFPQTAGIHDGCTIVPYPYTLKTNLSFVHEELYKTYVQTSGVAPYPLIFSCSIAGQFLYLCPFSIFQKLLVGDYI